MLNIELNDNDGVQSNFNFDTMKEVMTHDRPKSPLRPDIERVTSLRVLGVIVICE